MKTNTKRILALVFGFIGSIALGCALAIPAQADGPLYNQDWLTRKAIVADLSRCFSEGHMRDTVSLDSYGGLSSLANSDNDKIAALPTTFDKNVKTCRDLLDPVISGHTTATIPYYGDEGVASFLESLGYVPESTGTSSSMKCYQFQYTGTKYKNETDIDSSYNTFTYTTPKFCANVDADGVMVEDGLFIEGTSSGLDEGATDPFYYTNTQGTINVLVNSAEGENALDLVCFKGEKFWEDCISTRIYRSMPSWSMVGDRLGQHWTYNKTNQAVPSSSESIAATSFKITSSTPDTFTKALLGTTTGVFSPAERVSLYQIYLNADAQDMTCKVPDDQKSNLISNGYIDKSINLVVEGVTYNNCYVKADEKTYHGLDGQNWYKDVSLSEILDYLASTTVSSEYLNDVVSANATIYGNNNPGPGGDGGGGSGGNGALPTDADENEVNCFNAVGALGWILCPVIDFAQHTIYAIYDSIISGFLEIRADFLNINGQGNSIYTAWQVFQSFANIVFVIVLLIVIFSQLTGVGIDNLGIKRVLPKLIIAAILINLSYLICMLFVDISNILGVGLNNLFANITVSIDNSASTTGAAVLSTVVTGAVGGAVGALVAGTSPIWGGVVIIPLVLGLITTLIGVLFFFILLGARQAAVIMLVVISPIAFACYMLPNTKSIFDKWLKMFEALLLLYPLCGLMMGGSAFASKILLTMDTGFLGKLIAMLVGVVPFFFIPTLLRGAFSAMGNLGARISGFGQNMGRRITGAAANSDAVKDWNTRLRTGINRDGSLNAMGRARERAMSGNWASRSRIPGVHRIGTMVQESNKRANARAQAARIKYIDEQQRIDKLNSPDFFKQYQTSQKMAFEKEQFNAAVDAINEETDKGENVSALFARYDAAIANGNEFEAKAVAEIAGRRKDTANTFMKKFKEDSENDKYAGHEDIMRKVAKQMTTGDNSKNYRASNAMGFEYASSLVQRPDKTTTNYGVWKQDANNLRSALDHHVTNGKELYGQSNSSLEEMRELAAGFGKNDMGSKQYLADLARRGEFEGYNTGGEYDKTKEDNFRELKKLAAPLASAGDARPGEEFSTRTTVDDNIINRASTENLEKMWRDLDAKVQNRTAKRDEYERYQKLNRELQNRRNQNNQSGQA